MDPVLYLCSNTYGFVEDSIKKDEYGKIGFGPVSSSSSISPCSAARAAASAARSKASSAALIGSLKLQNGNIYYINIFQSQNLVPAILKVVV